MKMIGVVGAGTMGAAIGQAFAQHRFEVVIRDLDTAILDKAQVNIEKSLQKFVTKEKMTTQQRAAILQRLTYANEVKALAHCDLVIEAATENMAVKKKIFEELDTVVNENAILASNTSSLSITEIAAATKRPDKVIGMHFFNPVPVMQLVEIIRGITTSDETYQAVDEYAKAISKQVVEVSEAPGFVVNRILLPMINEAVRILAEGVATAESIDKAMTLGANHPIGPLALADLIGNDVCLAILETLYSEFGEVRYAPHPLLRKMVRAGYLGRKTAKGFYDYH